MLINVELSEMSSRARFRLAQLRDLPPQAAPILVSIAALKDTGTVVLSDRDSAVNRSVSLRLYFAPETGADSFLIRYYPFRRRGTKDSALLKDFRIGSIDFRSFVMQSNRGDSVKENILFAAKVIGCSLIMARVVYTTDEDLAYILEACKNWKVTP
jgi:hypothetical protein